jgi:putative DNA primase/helicase
MEMCKTFATAYSDYAVNSCSDDKEFLKYAAKLASRQNRERVLNDAKSIVPMPLSAFDTNRYLLNLTNGTYNLRTFALQPHNPADYITKMARVRFDQRAKCQRWERFIDEIMRGDKDTSAFLQKALGYALTGDTDAHNCFYILYGASTRNGKSTLTEAIGYILNDYARTVQPQTLARRSADGSAASPDIARLKGARFVCTPEPEKGLELNSALIKQLTGGDTYVGRFLHENLFEFVPEFHIFFNTNHLPRTNDDTIFASGRVKIIPFERHFTDKEQDRGLKGFFRKNANKSAILNWLIDGYRLMLETGMDVSARMQAALDEYRSESDLLGGFFAEKIVPAQEKKLQTSALYAAYTAQMRLCGSRPMSVQAFVGEVKKRYNVGRDRTLGTVIYNAALANL